MKFKLKLLIHDLKEEDFKKMFPNLKEDIMVVSNDAPIQNCVGCFGCWVKTPAACVIRDKYGDMGEKVSKCDELHIISECLYGGFSHFIKNVLDRSISYVHPYFVIRNGEMHHRSRYSKRIRLKVWFYGEDITNTEYETAKKLVKANAINLDILDNSVLFYNSLKDMEVESL